MAESDEMTNAQLVKELRESASWERIHVSLPAHHLAELAEIAAQRLESRGEITEAEVKIEMPDDLRCESEETDE